MIKMLLISLLLLLAGCSTYHSISQEGLANAKEYCSDKEGIYKIEVWWLSGRVFAYCKNGQTSGILPKK